MKSPLIALTVAGLLASAGAANAHHSGAMFDRSQTKMVTGTIKDFEWTNPHSSFSVVTNVGGTDEVWLFEMNSPQNLVREGWKRSTLTPGDKVTVTYNPLRDGKPGGWYVSIALPSGQTLGGEPPK